MINSTFLYILVFSRFLLRIGFKRSKCHSSSPHELSVSRPLFWALRLRPRTCITFFSRSFSCCNISSYVMMTLSFFPFPFLCVFQYLCVNAFSMSSYVARIYGFHVVLNSLTYTSVQHNVYA